MEAALRELLRDVVREELRYLRGEVLGWLERGQAGAGARIGR